MSLSLAERSKLIAHRRPRDGREASVSSQTGNRIRLRGSGAGQDPREYPCRRRSRVRSAKVTTATGWEYSNYARAADMYANTLLACRLCKQ